MKRDDASQRQVDAARPRQSTWLSANAGSGKTRVLTDRVARLLLDQVDPQKILCLTYTKAAASEMQNRLFRRLGSWAMMPDAELRAELGALGVEGLLDDPALRKARTHFALAIEAPGGLKIQTIHSFCSSLLRRFPLEAGVAPQFREMEDRAAQILRAEIVDDMAVQGDQTLTAILSEWSGADLDTLLAEIVKHREAFLSDPDPAQIYARFGVPEDLTPERIAAGVFGSDGADVLERMVQCFSQGSSTEAKIANAIGPVLRQGIGPQILPVLERHFLFGSSAAQPFAAKIKSLPTKSTREANPVLAADLHALMTRVEIGRTQRTASAGARRTALLHGFAQAFLPLYDARKQMLGALDFDDLINRSRALLMDPSVAQWVLFRLDGGIDHILVDEAQDTSPAQWDVVERLSQEFTAGQGAQSDHVRTLFVVGDKKQSIYSFQGADPEAFNSKRQEFGQRFEGAGLSLNRMSLDYSFRSASPVLSVVDAVFVGDRAEAVGQEGAHIAFKSEMPGRVDVWPWIEPDDGDEDSPWYEPTDLIARDHHTVQLADRIAGQIRDLIDAGHPMPQEVGHSGTYTNRPVRAGDFLILVQRRSTLFHEIIRACKVRNLPIAGADRLRVGAELAVRDLLSVLRFLALPEDDLALAEALRSPLFGWSEADLFALAHARGGTYLWAALRDHQGGPENTVAILQDLRDQADLLRPYELLERILTRHDGRRKLMARLGVEAEDGVDALLAQAMRYEQTEVPGLTGFLIWVDSDDLEIKRQLDSNSNQIRVMTVHGSKGLEAPIVILPETGQRQNRQTANVLMAEGLPIWKAGKDDASDLDRTASDAQRSRDEAERLRLLYVAMTRAEKWLIVCGSGKRPKDGGDWYDLIGTGVQDSGGAAHSFDFGPGVRLETGDWSAPTASASTSVASQTDHDQPDWMWAKADARTQPLAPRSPSDLGGAKALPGAEGQEKQAAMAQGTVLHRLLEVLPDVPRDDWPATANGIIAQLGDPDQDRGLIDDAIRVLDNPDFQTLFGPDSLGEVALVADLEHLGPIYGVVDRLVVTDDLVLAVDYKTNAVVPRTASETPEGILRQMGAYHAALTQIYPDRPVQTAILWTSAPRLDQLEQHDVIAALQRAQKA